MTVPFESPRPSLLLPDCGWTDLTRDQLRLHGRDATSFLHNFCTNDVKRLHPGEGCEAFLTNVKGRIVGHIFIFAGDSSLELDSSPGTSKAIRAHLDRYVITEDVRIELVPASERTVAYVFGADSESVLAEAIGLDVSRLKSGDHRHVSSSSHDVTIRRVEFTRTVGFEVLADAACREAVQLAVIGRGGTPIDHSAFDAFRIDAGFPIHGVDVSEDNLAQEAGRTEQAISFRKGCYLGQEPIARLDALGHVNRFLRVIAFERGSSPVRRDKVVDRESRAELGTISSVGRLAASAVVGMAVLRTSASPGSRVIAITGSGEVDGTVVPTDADHPSAA